MSHKRIFGKSGVLIREELPQLIKTKAGAELLCPFCKPTHSLFPGQDSPCGTVLKLTAVQTVIRKQTVRERGLICVKCQKGGGEMVHYMNGFIHTYDCNPGTSLIREIPKYTQFAKLVYRMPVRIRSVFERFKGKAIMVREIDQAGKETGEIAGFFFMKKRGFNGGSGQTPNPAAKQPVS